MEHWLWIILAALFFECKGEDKVMQTPGDVIATEGNTLTLNCTFKASGGTDYLFWYKQEVNGFPKYMLQRYTGAKDNPSTGEIFDAKIVQNSVPLKIQKLHVSDSAVYYCALRPTVTGNTTTLNKNLWSKDNAILHNIH